MHSQYTSIRWREKQPLHSQQTGPGIILKSAPQNMIFCLFTETKWQMFCGIPGFYSTSGAVDYTAVIFCAHLVAWNARFLLVLGKYSYALSQQPSWHVPPLLPADFTRQSIAHAWKSKWKRSIDLKLLLASAITRVTHTHAHIHTHTKPLSQK